MQTLLNYIYSVASALTVGVLGWAVNMNSRISVVEDNVAKQPKKDDDLKEFIKDLMDAKFNGLDRRLERIENNGNGHTSH